WNKLVITLAEKLLPQLTHLTQLILRDCQIGSKAARAFAQVIEENQRILKNLQWLDLSKNQLGVLGVISLLIIFIFNENSLLDTLSFDDLIKTSFLRKAINQVPHTRALILSNNKVDPQEEEVLKIVALQTAKCFDSNKKGKILMNFMRENHYTNLRISGLNVECMDILEFIFKRVECSGFIFSAEKYRLENYGIGLLE